jgi:hypothetical protein
MAPVLRADVVRAFTVGRPEDVSPTDPSLSHLWLQSLWHRQSWCQHRLFAVLVFAGIHV